jgi:ribosomal protein S18 acetylase RimI-like enzyme
VTVEQSPHDRRVRTVRLTRRGVAERRVLDRRSDALAQSLLEPLTDDQRTRLVSAMADVERLLTAALVQLDAVDPGHPHAQHCLREYFGELNRRFDAGFDPDVALQPELGVFVVATLHGEPVGCGALKLAARTPAEIKRMWVSDAVRGLGVGRRLLTDLEARAHAAGRRTVRLDTNRNLTEAIAMYRSSGYREVAPFNDEPYAHHWFEKPL